MIGFTGKKEISVFRLSYQTLYELLCLKLAIIRKKRKEFWEFEIFLVLFEAFVNLTVFTTVAGVLVDEKLKMSI